MPRNWTQGPEERTISTMEYRRTRYGQAEGAPASQMMRNMRRQQEFRQLS